MDRQSSIGMGDVAGLAFTGLAKMIRDVVGLFPSTSWNFPEGKAWMRNRFSDCCSPKRYTFEVPDGKLMPACSLNKDEVRCSQSELVSLFTSRLKDSGSVKTNYLANSVIVSSLKATANWTWDRPFVYWLDLLDLTRV